MSLFSHHGFMGVNGCQTYFRSQAIKSEVELRWPSDDSGDIVLAGGRAGTGNDGDRRNASVMAPIIAGAHGGGQSCLAELQVKPGKAARIRTPTPVRG